MKITIIRLFMWLYLGLSIITAGCFVIGIILSLVLFIKGRVTKDNRYTELGFSGLFQSLKMILWCLIFIFALFISKRFI